MSKVTHLTDRVSALEAVANFGMSSAASQPNHSSSASASPPQEDTMAASSASGSLPNKRKQTRQIKFPKFDPWPMNSGECNKCNRAWSTDESRAHFMLVPDVWEQAMSTPCQNFTTDGRWCDYVEGSVHSPDNVTQSLVASGVVPEANAEDVASTFRRMIWQPDCPRDARHFFLFKGGHKMSKYISFGCVHCQRGTSLYYPTDHFMTNLRMFFSHSLVSPEEGMPAELKWLWCQRSLEPFLWSAALAVGTEFTQTFETRGVSLQSLKPLMCSALPARLLTELSQAQFHGSPEAIAPVELSCLGTTCMTYSTGFACQLCLKSSF